MNRKSKLKSLIERMVRLEVRRQVLREKSIRKTKKADKKGEILQKALQLPTDEFAKRFKRVASDSKVQAILKAGKTDGNPGDEKVSYSETSLPLKELYPTQNIIGFEESLKHLLDNKYNSLNTILDGKPNMGGPIITANGKWIIDGHHRWSQSYIGNPNGEIKAIDLKINLKPNQIKNIVHMAIAASVGSLPLNDAKGENLLKASKDVIKKYAIDGLEAHPDVVKIWMKYPKLIGTNDSDPKSVIPVIAEYIAKNAEEMQESNGPAYSGAPGRDSMPQTDKDGHDGKMWLAKLQKGKINFIDPKKDDVKQENKMNRKTKLKTLIERMVRREVRRQVLKENSNFKRLLFSGESKFMRSSKVKSVFNRYGFDIKDAEVNDDGDILEYVFYGEEYFAEKAGNELERLDTSGSRYGGWFVDGETNLKGYQFRENYRRRFKRKNLRENAASQEFVKALEDFPWETMQLMDPQERKTLINVLKQHLANMEDVDDHIEVSGVPAGKFRNLTRSIIARLEKSA